ncbi:MAG TPA: hypothetical protein VGL91_16320 [Acidobacteriota bacterium]
MALSSGSEIENQLVAKLGRELTARERFYLALSEVCSPSDRISAEEDKSGSNATCGVR